MANKYTVTVTGSFGAREYTFRTIGELRNALAALGCASNIPHTGGEMSVSRFGYIVEGKRLSYTQAEEDAEKLSLADKPAPAPEPAKPAAPFVPEPLAHGGQNPVKVAAPDGQVGPVSPRK